MRWTRASASKISSNLPPKNHQQHEKSRQIGRPPPLFQEPALHKEGACPRLLPRVRPPRGRDTPREVDKPLQAPARCPARPRLPKDIQVALAARGQAHHAISGRALGQSRHNEALMKPAHRMTSRSLIECPFPSRMRAEGALIPNGSRRQSTCDIGFFVRKH